jgi:predicted lipoprotein with Yx(FWY)xxD motif
MRTPALLALAPAAAAVAIAGCGGSTVYGAPAKPTGAAAPASGPTVALGSAKLGKILVNGSGRTLYAFAADRTTSSACYGSCASLWPPLTVTGSPKGGTQLDASLLGTAKRTDGTTQVTYNGHPLYRYAGDSKPGDTTGQAISQFGARWYTLKRSGAEVTHG